MRSGAFVAAVLALLVAAAACGPVVHAPAGPVEGVTAGDVDSFLGIPFAEPPVGALRWKPPVATNWTEVRPALAYGNSCMQGFRKTFPWNVSISEDCLFLNVWRPAGLAADAKAPVLVWIYGGNYVGGTTSIYPLDLMVARATRPVVIVSINYRVNIFGFFTGDSESYNYGLMDQQMGLAWVRRNVAAFGGDAQRVTIFGESAGGNSVSMHLLMPNSFDLYEHAILESPAPWAYPTVNQSMAMREFVAAKMHCPAAGAAAMTCMRGLDAAELMDTVYASGLLFQPVVGDPQLKVQPFVMWYRGMMRKDAPIIVGFNEQEGNLFAWQASAGKLTMTKEEFNAVLDHDAKPFGKEVLDDILKQYGPLIATGDYFRAFADIVADSGIVCGANMVARTAARSSSAPTYRYVFRHKTAKWLFAALNATHTSEISYVMNNPAEMLSQHTPEEAALAQQVSDYWVHFATYGSLDGTGWPRYDPGAESTLLIDIPITVGNASRLVANCPFWDAVLLKALQ